VVFTNSAGCVDVCAEAGLLAAECYDNVNNECDFTGGEIACNLNHMSDYCVCDEVGGGMMN
jgi:hypothetical protein